MQQSPLEYDEIDFLEDTDLISTKQGEKYGWANTRGEILFPCVYDIIFIADHIGPGLNPLKVVLPR